MYDDEVMILDEKVNYIDTAENLWKVIAMTIEEILWNCTVETTPLNVGCDYMSYPFVLKNIFCVVYDATFCCFFT